MKVADSASVQAALDEYVDARIDFDTIDKKFNKKKRRVSYHRVVMATRLLKLSYDRLIFEIEQETEKKKSFAA